MRIERQQEGSDFINAQFVQDSKLDKLRIASDVELSKSKFDETKTQHVVDISYEGWAKGSPSKWKLSANAINTLIDKYGDETKNWVDKEVPITLAGEGQFKYVTVDKLRI